MLTSINLTTPKTQTVISTEPDPANTVAHQLSVPDFEFTSFN